MKLLIDSLISATGWVVNSPSTIEEIEEKKYIAGLNSKSLMIKFDENDATKTATKTFGTPFDVTDYETLVFSVWSQKNAVDQLYIKPADFSYKIDIDGVLEFYFPIYTGFNSINLGIEDITSITQIKITAVHEITDYIIISEMVAEKEEIPLDVLDSVKENLDYFINLSQSNGLLLGTVTGTTGDETLSINNPDYLERYGVIKIDDTVNDETHQVEDNDSLIFNMNDNFDGKALLNDFTNANVYLQFPTFINPGQFEIFLPGIAIWGIDPEPILRGSKLDIERTSFTDSNSKERLEGQLYEYSIQLHCEARSQELIDIMTRCVRMFIGRESLWINGRRHDIYFDGPPTEIKPQEGIDYLPKVIYQLKVEVKESLFDRNTLPITQNIIISVTPE